MNEELIDLRSIEKDNLSGFDWQLYHILKKELLSNSLTTAGGAAAQINELLLVEIAEPANTSDIDKNPERAEINRTDMIEENLWTFWVLLIKIVKLVPYNHAWQGRLLSILEALSRLPPMTIEIWGVRFFFRCFHVMKSANQNHQGRNPYLDWATAIRRVHERQLGSYVHPRSPLLSTINHITQHITNQRRKKNPPTTAKSQMNHPPSTGST